jgi:hypothetical protein
MNILHESRKGSLRQQKEQGGRLVWRVTAQQGPRRREATSDAPFAIADILCA